MGLFIRKVPFLFKDMAQPLFKEKSAIRKNRKTNLEFVCARSVQSNNQHVTRNERMFRLTLRGLWKIKKLSYFFSLSESVIKLLTALFDMFSSSFKRFEAAFSCYSFVTARPKKAVTKIKCKIQPNSALKLQKSKDLISFNF